MRQTYHPFKRVSHGLKALVDRSSNRDVSEARDQSVHTEMLASRGSQSKTFHRFFHLSSLIHSAQRLIDRLISTLQKVYTSAKSLRRRIEF